MKDQLATLEKYKQENSELKEELRAKSDSIRKIVTEQVKEHEKVDIG